jgi:hypothetical protein
MNNLSRPVREISQHHFCLISLFALWYAKASKHSEYDNSVVIALSKNMVHSHASCKEDEDMPTNITASLRQTFHITVDIEVALHASPPAEARNPMQESYHRDLVERLSAHPYVMGRLQRACSRR